MSQQILIQSYAASWLWWQNDTGRSWKSKVVTRKATHSKNCEFVRVLKCNAAVAKNRKNSSASQKGWQKVITHSFCNFSNFANQKWEFEMPERIWVLIWLRESDKHYHRFNLFHGKDYSFHFYRKKKSFEIFRKWRSLKPV